MFDDDANVFSSDECGTEKNQEAGKSELHGCRGGTLEAVYVLLSAEGRE